MLFVYLITTSFLCRKCITSDLKLDSYRSWLKSNGNTISKFKDQTGNTVNLFYRVIDTTETASNIECGTTYNYEYKNNILYLNTSKTDSIFFSLASGGWICMNACSNGNTNISMCNVMGHTKEARVAKRLNDFIVGNKSYPDVILILSSLGFVQNIDSVILANNFGIVSFKYNGNKYNLEE
jgi:Pyruvate/2-oxoacid:ferredoxin oxidoreductase delta subunit